MKYSFRVLSICTVLMFGLPRMAPAEAYGGPFQFNRLPHTSNVISTDVATGANGDTAVLWTGGTNGNGVYLQRFDFAGRALQGQERLVAPGTPGAILVPQVAVAGNGTFVVASNEPDGSGLGVYVSIYDRFGNTVIPRFRVNNLTNGNQTVSSVAMNANGQFVVTYGGTSPTTGLPAIYVKFYQLNGSALNAEILVHSNVLTSDRIEGVESGVDSAGNVVITWSYGDVNSLQRTEVYARRYAWNGAPLGNTFLVNSYVSGDQGSSRVAVSSDGSFTIVWGGASMPNVVGITGRRYDAAGNPGNEFQISQSGYPFGLDIAATPSGFVVTWERFQIFARPYSPSGVALEPETQVSEVTTGSPATTRVSADPSGNFFVTWMEHNHNPATPLRVWGRRYSPSGITIQPLYSGQIVSPLDGAAGSWRYFKLTVPTGQTILDAAIFGGAGDADMYIRYGAVPTLSSWDVRPFVDGNDESVRITGIPPGVWYIGIRGFLPYSGLSLQSSSL